MHYSESIGAKLCPEFPAIPKLEIIVNNAIALYNLQNCKKKPRSFFDDQKSSPVDLN